MHVIRDAGYPRCMNAQRSADISCMRILKHIVMVSVLALCCAGCRTGHVEVMQLRASEPALADLAWMTGAWASDTGEIQSEEHWTQAAAGTMFGVNRTMRQGKTVFFEFLRIEVRDAGVFYLASPAGRHPPTEFRMVAANENKVVFENPDHDFPTRITYWLDGDTLHATAEGEVRGVMRSEVFQWQRARLAH